MLFSQSSVLGLVVSIVLQILVQQWLPVVHVHWLTQHHAFLIVILLSDPD
jgi:hypothetical protein